MKTNIKQQRKLAFKAHLRTVAANKMSSGPDTFMRLMNSLMKSVSHRGEHQTLRQYKMMYDKAGYAKYVRALRLNMLSMRVNKKEYGSCSWLNCNDI